MGFERTLSIIKSDAVAKNLIREFYSRFESNGLKIIAARMMRLSQADAEGLYKVHYGRPFFTGLIKFMTSGAIVVQVLEGKDAINKNRILMGAIDPEKAEKGTIRTDYAESMQINSVHGSDASKTAALRNCLFFSELNLF